MSYDPSELHGANADAKQADQAVEAVVAWYTARIGAALRAPGTGTDPARLAEWKRGKEEALADQDRLETATPEETAEIAVLYAARLKALTAQ